MMSPKLPQHLAIIMDGNGRWAKLRGHNRTFGHIKGARVAKQIIELCAQKGIKYLTLYAFSTENWLRPQQEVLFLMNLLSRHLKKERNHLIQNNIKFNVIGDRSKLPNFVQEEVEKSILATSHCTGMQLNFALSYGSRQEIVESVQKIALAIQKSELQIDQIDPDLFSKYLQTAQIPDPDLIIRTSGEYRLSNFMMWQAAYSEFYFTNIHWPDFNEVELNSALDFFSKRIRRFGKVLEKEVPQISKNMPSSDQVLTQIF